MKNGTVLTIQGYMRLLKKIYAFSILFFILNIIISYLKKLYLLILDRERICFSLCSIAYAQLTQITNRTKLNAKKLKQLVSKALIFYLNSSWKFFQERINKKNYFYYFISFYNE